MRTFYNKLAVLGLVGFVLASCGTSNDVVSGHLISKRKVNKGFFFNHSKAPKSDEVEAQQTRQPFIQYTAENEEFAEEQNLVASTDQAPLSPVTEATATENDAPVIESTENAPVENHISAVRQPAKIFAPEHVKTKIDKKTKAEFRQAKKHYREAHKEDGARLLVLVIICLFIPPLAVYLSEGSWNTTCWINLLLTLLFFLPGLIHGLIVILT